MDQKRLNKIEHFEVAIIGGGIVGAGLFRDQALHGVKTIVIDQADFNSQTSAGSSKMLHGGIRYLENFDFPLVYEALYEKNLWLKLAPHIAKEIPFYLPVYKTSKWPLLFVRIGLFIYDLLSLFKNSPHKSFSKKQTKQKLSGINQEGLTGSGMYHDGIVDDAKLGLECIYDGLRFKNAKALNYTKLTKVEKKENIYYLELTDVLTKKVFSITTDYLHFATGPFTDIALKELGIPWTPVLAPSKGTHLWLKKDALKLDQALVLQTKDGRVIFVIPQRETILVGTTEIPLKENESILNIKATEEEIDYLLSEVNNYFPHDKVTKDEILSSFCAVRPLVKTGENSSKISRNHKIYQPQQNMYVITGGKYTTFRRMAEDLNKKTFKAMNKKYDKSLSKTPFQIQSIVGNPFEHDITHEMIQEIIKKELVRTKEDLIERRLSLPSLDHYKNKNLNQLLDKAL